ncbi:MAG TPA: hypothetical protein VF656_17465 [Pyrinomonadaceae bacterium]|jgi:hypothetical protein
MQQNQDCYGTVLEPFHVSANWTTSNTTVLSIDTNRIAHAQTEGTSTITAFWRAFIYTDGGASGCEASG